MIQAARRALITCSRATSRLHAPKMHLPSALNTSRLSVQYFPARAFASLPSLNAIIEREIKEEKKNGSESENLVTLREKVEETFEIIHEPGNMEVELKGKVGDRSVRIRFNAQDTAEVDNEDWEGQEEEEEYEEIGGSDGDDEVDELPNIRFLAEIIRNQQSLQFDCVAGSNVTIEKVRFAAEALTDCEKETRYEGPDFIDFEIDMQEQFYDYLRQHCIDDDLAQFITEFADAKEQKEYLTFLQNASKFIKK